MADFNKAKEAGNLLVAQSEECAFLEMVFKTIEAAFVYLCSRLALCIAHAYPSISKQLKSSNSVDQSRIAKKSDSHPHRRIIRKITHSKRSYFIFMYTFVSIVRNESIFYIDLQELFGMFVGIISPPCIAFLTLPYFT